MEVFKILGTVAIDGVDKATKGLEGLGNVATKVGKAMAAGIAAGATAVGAMTKSAVESYAEYEQLVGGVDTLFKESSEKVQQYAARAYQTAGMSANEYMSTVTSFSASLLQGLAGDTDKAAEIADMALQDMSDNANKMGTDMASIQNAYQGFAKQNYTMLDNLKLGYGGTQEEMQRLLKDAQKLSGVKYDISNLSDVYSAIHVIQEEMGITGTTAKEASETISGSLASTKAAWQNLLTGFANDEANLEMLIGNLVDSATTAVHNLVPRIAQILSGISDALAQIIPVISAELPAILQELLPGLIDGAVALVNGLVASLPVILQILIEQLPYVITQIGQGLVQTFPILLETVMDLFGQIWSYIATQLLGTEANFETSFANIQGFFEDAWSVIETVWNSIGQPVFDLIQSCVEVVRGVFAEKMPEIQEFVSRCFGDIGAFWKNNLKPCLEAIGNFIENILAPIFEAVFNVVIFAAVENAFDGIKNLWEHTLKPILTGITDFLTGVFTLNFKKAFQGIVSVVKGIFGGIITVVKSPINSVINIVNSFIRGLNKIKVPSWVPGLGGKGINIPMIPKLAEGGILEKGQVGLLEGNGAEAVVPLDQNKAWISAVARDMESAIGGNNEVRELKEQFEVFVDRLPEMLVDAFSSMKFDVNNREFARMVKAVG